MCFHSKQTKGAQAIQKRFKAKVKEAISSVVSSSNYNGFDFPKTPVITNLNSSEVELFHWGLIPSWSNDESIRVNTLNARIETLDEKPSFKHHATHRCLVLSDGFYEWQWLDSKGKKKQKYTVELPNNELYAYAGIWSEWFNNKGESIYTYSIVTTEAQGIMREVHNSKMRMPVVLPEAQELDWLKGMPVNEVVAREDFVANTQNFQGSLF